MAFSAYTTYELDDYEGYDEYGDYYDGYLEYGDGSDDDPSLTLRRLRQQLIPLSRLDPSAHPAQRTHTRAY